jgi:hypothetical protein
MDERDRALDAAHRAATAFLATLADRPVWPRATLDEMMAVFGGPLPEEGLDAEALVDDLARKAEPGLVAIPGGRFFGFVIGSTLPAALAADWLVSAWDQNSGSSLVTPTTVALERVAGEWILDMLGLPIGASVGYVTGAQVSKAANVPEIIEEMLRTTTSERQSRAIDAESAGAMENRKREGYF